MLRSIPVSSVADGQSENFSTVAKTFLPPSAFAMYSHLSQQEGGINGFLQNLKGKDLQGVIDEVKKVGGDETKRVIEKVRAEPRRRSRAESRWRRN